MKLGTIYALLDPHGRIRYVGQTTNIQRRFAAITDLRRPSATGPLVRQWVERHAGKVGLRILEECDDLDDRERFWIAKLRAEDCPLLNIQPGGVARDKRAPPVLHLMQLVLASWEKSEPDPEDIAFLKELIRQSSDKVKVWKQRHSRCKQRSRRGAIASEQMAQQ